MAPSTPSDVAAMVTRIQQAGGVLRLSGLSREDRARWRRTIHAAINQGGLPDGTRLRHSGRDHGDLVIRLVADTAANEPRKPQTPKVPVPARLPARPHPIVAATREAATPAQGWVNTRRTPGVAHISVAKPSVPRALRLLQGLFAEAERRGYQTTTTSGDRTCAGGSAVVIDGHRLEVVLAEERTPVPHQLTAAEQDRPAAYQWAPRGATYHRSGSSCGSGTARTGRHWPPTAPGGGSRTTSATPSSGSRLPRSRQIPATRNGRAPSSALVQPRPAPQPLQSRPPSQVRSSSLRCPTDRPHQG